MSDKKDDMLFNPINIDDDEKDDIPSCCVSALFDVLRRAVEPQ